MKIKWGKLLLHIAIPLLVGGASALLTRGSMELFSTVQKPPLSPPGWLFPVVWTVLYILMGIASYRVSESDGTVEQKNRYKTVYTVSLFFNFFWSLIFFNLQAYWFAFAWLVILWGLILVCMLLARKMDSVAFWCLVPYFVWVSFAGYLNFGIALLN